MSNYVYLNSKYNEFYLDDEAYAQVVAIVQANKQCLSTYQERHPYTEGNPCVGKNICLEHLLKKQPNLSFGGQHGFTNDSLRIYTFLDTQGYVYTTTEDSTEEARRNTTETLAYYGFTPPLKIESRG